MTEKQAYENVKKLHKKYPDITMKPSDYKKKRNKELNMNEDEDLINHFIEVTK